MIQTSIKMSEVLSEVLSKRDFDKLRRYLNILIETGYIVSEGRTNNIVYKRNTGEMHYCTNSVDHKE